MLNAIVDLSHHNGAVNLKAAAADGILGIIHKATQGVGYVDPLYETNRESAAGVGLWWGAYHFGTGGDGVAQAAHFLDVVQPHEQTLLVLDLEANGQGPSMGLTEAAAFLTHIQQMTGQIPGLYAGHYLKELLGNASEPVLAKSWLWLSQYGPTPVVPANWPTWTLWQYTDGGLGPEPHEVAGIGLCDRDLFNGDRDALKTLWGITP